MWKTKKTLTLLMLYLLHRVFPRSWCGLCVLHVLCLSWTECQDSKLCACPTLHGVQSDRNGLRMIDDGQSWRRKTSEWQSGCPRRLQTERGTYFLWVTKVLQSDHLLNIDLKCQMAIAELEQMFGKLFLINPMIDIFRYSFLSQLKKMKNALCVQ